ncbi:FAD-binding oxidoreductase [Methylobacterium aerolatum]|uniref:FAD/FMN-containing dehydrogenase n=1 Tax=Methylobacterium aerolatum TaxID=418708 RepID=A0ABU0I1D9_9HYPH|nr:FAD-binding oxidoreductase [Methylobacterium aerolatum]MDQ0448419.1 FAD/FMN-containing dehydrogenase [Methylobacterium aerolatum]
MSPPSATPGTADALLDALRGAVGARHVLTDHDLVAPYLVESRRLFAGSALAVVRPGSTAEVARIVRLCAQAGIPFVALGGNTGLTGGGIPQGGVVIALERLNRVRAVDPVGATLTVEAGAILAEVQEAAEAAGMLFPLTYASRDSARIGGGIATNAGGLNVLAYGNARDLVLGLEVVLADGRVWNGLKALRKDNAGYDLKHLFIGSEGTLGIVTAAVLRLFPKPRSTGVAFLGLASARAALDLFVFLRDRADRDLTAFEYLPPFALEIVLRHAAGTVRPLTGEHGAYALIEFSSCRPGIEARHELEAVLAEALARSLIEDAALGAGPAQDSALWRLREAVPEAQTREGGSIKHDVSVPLGLLPEFLERAGAACVAAMPGLRPCGFGHFGDGNIHFNLSQPVGMDREAFLAHWERFNRIVHDIVTELGGSIAAEHGVGLIKRAELARYGDPVALDLMRTLKASLDPLNLLNPGKVVPPAPDDAA